MEPTPQPLVELHVTPKQFQRMKDAELRGDQIPLMGWWKGTTIEAITKLLGTPFCPEIKVIVDWSNTYGD